MTTDKRQTLDNLLADIFREPPLISTDIEPAPSASPDQPPTASAFSDQPPSAVPDQPPSAVPDQPNGEVSDPQTPIADTSPDKEEEVKLAEQAKSLLAGLNRDTAIRLRWAMRDIRGKRTKMSPVSENDLAALIDLGFVEMREGIARLTGLGILVLD